MNHRTLSKKKEKKLYRLNLHLASNRLKNLFAQTIRKHKKKQL